MLLGVDIWEILCLLPYVFRMDITFLTSAYAIHLRIFMYGNTWSPTNIPSFIVYIDISTLRTCPPGTTMCRIARRMHVLSWSYCQHVLQLLWNLLKCSSAQDLLLALKMQEWYPSVIDFSAYAMENWHLINIERPMHNKPLHYCLQRDHWMAICLVSKEWVGSCLVVLPSNVRMEGYF